MLVYHCYDNLSLISSSLALFKKMDIVAGDSEDFEFYGSNYLLNENQFFLANAKNIALANNRNLAVLEDDAYKNTIFSKTKIDENPNLYNFIESELAKFSLQYSQDTQILHLVQILHNNLEVIKTHIKSDFTPFSVAVFGSDSNLCGELGEILEAIKIKVNFIDTNEFFKIPNKDLALKYSAKCLENALDSGSDFIIANSMGIYEIFDKQRKALNKIANRNLGKMPVLFLPQVLLLAFGIRDESSLNLRYHTFIPDFL